jgi:hypothetical protein
MIVDQTTFLSALLEPDAARPEGLTDGFGRPAGRRFDVYRNNVAVSLTEALETAFPVVRKLVGADNFKLLAAAFLRKHPPTSPLMMFYGGEMPEFLSAFGPTKSTGYLPDVARLELLIRESYHAEDAAPIAPASLQALSPDELTSTKLLLSPAIRLLQSRWPVFAIWRFNMESGAPKPEMAAEDVLIVRPDMDPLPRLLPPGAATFITTLSAGETFGSAMDNAARHHKTFDLSEVLTLLIETQVLTKIGD